MQCEKVESWKEIANFLGRSVRTVQRWEATEKLPVRRHVHERGGTVFAYKDELSEWRSSRQFLWTESEEEWARQAVVQSPLDGQRKRRAIFGRLLGAAVTLAALAAVAAIWFNNPIHKSSQPESFLAHLAAYRSQYSPGRDEGHLLLERRTR